MAEDKFILMSMNDESSKKLSEVLGNKTCKKILNFLSERKEASEKDISRAINSPLNTTEYNLKKLIDAKLVEKTTNFFWSLRGKKIPLYKLSNKSIIISPRKSDISSKLKSILPVAFISGIAAIVLRQIYKAKETVNPGRALEGNSAETFSSATERSIEYSDFFLSEPSTLWIWFLAGTLFALFVLVLLNWRKL